MAFNKKNSGSFNTSYLPQFGNKHVDTLLEATLNNAYSAVEHSNRDSEVIHLVDEYQTGAMKAINCVNLRGLVDEVQDEQIKSDLHKNFDAIVKHSKFNASFAVKMKNFKAYDKGKRMAYADTLLAEGKENNDYPSANTLNILLQNCSTLEKAMEKVQELDKRGVVLNAKGLDILLGVSKNKSQADAIFNKYAPQTGVNVFIMNKMIKFCDGIDEARDLIQNSFAVTGLQLNHGSMLSLVSCAKNAEEADQIMASLVQDLGYSNYLINARLKHDEHLFEMEQTIKKIEEAAFLAGQSVIANSDSFAYVTKKLIDAGDITGAQFYLRRTEVHQKKENKKPNRFFNYLKKTLAGKQEEQPEKTADSDKV